LSNSFKQLPPSPENCVTEKIHDDVERALEAFGGVKFSYHTFGRFAIQPRLWVTAEKNPPPLDLPPLDDDDDEPGHGQPRYEMDAPPIRLVEPEPPAPTASVPERPPAPFPAPPPRREAIWADPEPAALPPRRPAPVDLPPPPPYATDLAPEPMAAPAPADEPVFAPAADPAAPEPVTGEALFFPEAVPPSDPDPEPDPEPAVWSEPTAEILPDQAPEALAAEALVAEPVVTPPVVSAPVAIPAPTPPPAPAFAPIAAVSAAPSAREPITHTALPPSNLLTLAALSNGWHAASAPPASAPPLPAPPLPAPPVEPKSAAPVAVGPAPPEPAIAPAPVPEPAGELNIFQLAWSRAAIPPADKPDRTAGAHIATVPDPAAPKAAAGDAPMPSEKDLFRRI